MDVLVVIGAAAVPRAPGPPMLAAPSAPRPAIVAACTGRRLHLRRSGTVASDKIGPLGGDGADVIGRPDLGRPRASRQLLLESAPALLVVDRGHPIGVVTRTDLVANPSAGTR